MKPSPPNTQRRSKLVVDARLQGGIVKRIVLHWLTFVTVGTALAALLRFLTHPTVPLNEQIGAMVASFGPFLVTMFALLPVFVVDTIKLTNRFAGPYVRFRRHIRALANQEQPGPVKFRDGDYWRETEADLNSLLEEIEQLRSEVNTSRSQRSGTALKKADDSVTGLQGMAATPTGPSGRGEE